MDVWLVEDDDLVRHCLREVLRGAGHATHETGSAEQALAMIAGDGQAPRIVVTDINLGPGMDGLSFARAVRDRAPGVAVVFISGRYQTLLGLGERDRFLPKPFASAALLQAIEELAAVGA